MLEYSTNQASGLLGLGCQPGPRLIAMVSHGDEQAELPLLWQLCLALVNFGYSVTVLDATTCESDANPGLEQLLDDAHWHDDDVRDTAAWTVLPASQGVQNLCGVHASKLQNLRQLGHLFPADGIVILYCKVEWMIALIRDCSVEPLLAVSPMRTSLLTSYLALKRLLITGKLKPTIVNMIQDQNSGSAAAQPSVSAGLSECAKKFLGHDVKALDIKEQSEDSPLYGDIQRLALRLLESAVVLGTGYLPIGTSGRAAHAAPFDRPAGRH